MWGWFNLGAGNQCNSTQINREKEKKSDIEKEFDKIKHPLSLKKDFKYWPRCSNRDQIYLPTLNNQKKADKIDK